VSDDYVLPRLTPAAPAPRLAISTASLAGSLEDKLGAAAAAGFSSIELLGSDLVMSYLAPRRIRAEAARLGMSVETFQPLHVEAQPDGLFDRQLRRAERALDVVTDLGASVLLLCSSASADGIDDDDTAADQLRRLADLAEGRGVRLAYEAVPWGRVASHEHAWRLVRAVDHPALGLCLDSFHVLSAVNDASIVDEIPTASIFHVQLADAPRLHLVDRAWSLHHRTYPGQGVLDVAGFVRRLADGGYAGPMALEVFNDVHQQEDPRYAATGAMRAMRSFTELVGDLGGTTHRSTGLFNVALPAPPPLSGFAFVEIAVDDVSAAVVEEAVGALGFRRTGRHRSKPVDLWEQGDARLLINRAPHRSVEPATAAVCAVAVESSDPRASAARASRLFASRLPRLRAPDEVEIESVAAPDGTAVFFCDSSVDGSWIADFGLPQAAPDADVLLSAIDHVSLAESIDDFDQTALFYRSVLGLGAGATAEVTAPFGLIRTWSAADASRRVRVSLSTAPLRRGGWAPTVVNPQHIGLTTPDAVRCAMSLRDAGVRILPIPDNYYDDLAADTDVEPTLLESMRQNSILHDRDEHGEYLHFYTEIVASRLFFEVVQRIGDYDGLGATRSTALRMAGHRRQRLRVVSGGEGRAVDESWQDRHDYSLAHLTALSLSPPELVEAAASGGYRYVGLRLTKVTMEEPHYPLTYDPALMRATRTRLAATGVEVLDVELARLASGDRPRDFLRFLEAGAELGAKHVITQLPDSDFARKTDKFAELCQLARPLGLTVDLEFPSWTETPSLGEAARVLRAADQPNAGMLVDLLHFARSGSSIEELRGLPPEWFHFVHVCDAPAEIPDATEELIHTARFERLFPGEGGIDVHAILDALPSGLPYALEIPRATLSVQVGAKEHARLAIAASRRHLDTARSRST
jgi:4-hydroxyphenylpyruvate dioxygenase-like putative hemolysin/sugar phosphate isomerase/epimerase